MFKKALIGILLISLLVLPTRVFAVNILSLEKQIENILRQIKILQIKIEQIENTINIDNEEAKEKVTEQKKEHIEPVEEQKEVNITKPVKKEPTIFPPKIIGGRIFFYVQP
jgi:regulator of replication initiation timing